MARIRYLKPDFFRDEHLAQLPYETRLFYQGLWCYADKEGRGEDRPERLKVDVMPYDKIDAEKMMELLAKPKSNGRPFIIRYIVNKEKYYYIVNWHLHQRPHNTEADSKIPPPPPLTEKGMEKGKEKAKPNPTFRPSLDNGEIYVKDTLKTKNPEFQTCWQHYLEMRQKIRKPATEHAKELILKELIKLSAGDEAIQIKILEQSIKNSWQSVFALKPVIGGGNSGPRKYSHLGRKVSEVPETD